jgi:class 3 adenylate cyclase/YHS domain-containing protein
MGMEKLIAILMADLSGYTAMTEVHGPAQAMSMVDKFIKLVERSLPGKSRLFERVGDQVVIISEDADDLARTAVALHKNSQKEVHFLPVHAGLHFGSVVEQYGSFYGSTINVAARIASEAKDGSLLASFEFITALKNPKSFHYKLYGTPHFKNVVNPTRLFKIIPEVTDYAPVHFIDPVCHMQLEENENDFIYNVDGKEYRFCSHECLNLFKTHQIQFVNSST